MNIEAGDRPQGASIGKRKAASPSPERVNSVTPARSIDVSENGHKGRVARGDGPKLSAAAEHQATVENDDNEGLSFSHESSGGDDHEEDDLNDEEEGILKDLYGMSEFDEDELGPPELEVEEKEVTLPRFQGSKAIMKSYRHEDDDEFEEWMHSLIVTINYEGKELGRAVGRYVKRSYIRDNFWRSMEEPCQELSSVAFELFDRYGRLKEEFASHPVRKGTGSWGHELDLGNIFILEHVLVDRQWRRKGIGKSLTTTLISKANTGERSSTFTIVSPGYLTREVEKESNGMTKEEEQKVHVKAHDASTAFYRALGFRRIGASSCFGLAADVSHRAHALAIADDFDLPELEPETLLDFDDKDDFFGTKLEEAKLNQLKERLPLHHAAQSLPDGECVKHFQCAKKAEESEQWSMTDRHGNNVLHQAALGTKAKSVQWLLDNVNQDQRLSSTRNRDGYTPLELLTDQLETLRNTRQQGLATVVTSDSFRGFSNDAILCMAALKFLKTPSDMEILQLKFGCTCGGCIDGLLSPRMRFALLCQAEIAHDTLLMEVDDPEMWCMMNIYTEHVAPDIQRNFRTNKSLRRGFANIFDHAAEALRTNELPSIPNLVSIWMDSGEWPPVTQNFYKRGGTTESALRAIFEFARDQDEWAGDGEHRETFGDEIDALPKCRNDHEFGFVALACGVPGFGQYMRSDAVNNLIWMIRRGTTMAE
ncbi:hypothetical protein ONS95_010919 [Cadophora gregata]|uniref:uncharacterized protein n=1 Tax=Cadophora gregata TaxID=51156 RepID=UPI0026DBE0AF|nr:uncharacterized protein ONS95_010919 [Cadophora gregata]KAK0119471.1 hypothetical protein ONS95_010919 [Cadophora gregata]KAK0120512.1 hypothetical protein ONS96_010720 [Cadophora gregata f. sp. sojae]